MPNNIKHIANKLPWNSVWITGASSGIGRELSKQLSFHGVTVYASARSTPLLDTLIIETREHAGKIISTPLDITNEADVNSLFKHWKSLDIIPDLAILNAGTHDAFHATDFSSARAKNLINLNLYGAIHCLDPLLRLYLAHSSGHIAVVSSAAGYMGLPSAAAYGASKAALINLCESLNFDLQAHKIKLQIINPGFVKTPLTDLNDFKMPCIIDSTEAAQAIIKGLQSKDFEIRFPKGFMYMMTLLKILPYSIYFKLINRITK